MVGSTEDALTKYSSLLAKGNYNERLEARGDPGQEVGGGEELCDAENHKYRNC